MVKESIGVQRRDTGRGGALHAIHQVARLRTVPLDPVDVVLRQVDAGDVGRIGRIGGDAVRVTKSRNAVVLVGAFGSVGDRAR